MSLPVFENSVFFFLMSSVSVAFLGSWHCAGMCGPIAALSTKLKTMAFYQTGRLISYVTLGTLAATFGEKVLSWIPEDRKWVVTVSLGVLSLWVLMANWNFDFPLKIQKFLWRHRPRGKEATEFFSLGVLNGLLPCHWLYGFLLVAAGFGHPVKGALLLFALWAGSLPWLLGASSLSRFLKSKMGVHAVWVARGLMLALVLGLILQGFMGVDPHLGCKLSEF